jgi:hypothetical protein
MTLRHLKCWHAEINLDYPMKFTPRFSLLASLALLAGSRLMANTINPIVTYTSDSPLSDSRPFTLGYEFSLSTSETVNALGYWTEGEYSAGQQVGLWTAGGGLITSTTIQAADPVADNFQWDSISPVVLGPGTYVIAGTYEGGIFSSFASGVTSLPGYIYVTSAQSYGAGLNFPNDFYNGYGSNGILQVDLSVGAASAPDAASTVALLGGALSLLGAARRRLRR